MTDGRIIEIDYTNHMGKRSIRRIRPTGRMLVGLDDWHPDAPWLIEARDVERNVMRTFDPAKIHRWGDAALAPAQGPAAGVAPVESTLGEKLRQACASDFNRLDAAAAPPPGPAPSGDAVLSDLREEIGYWRRDAAARIWSSKALMQAYRKEGRDDLAFAHRDALRAAVGASEEVQAQNWHSSCELCGKPMLPGEATYYFANEGISAHDRCAVEGATDDTGAPDPTDAEWLARTLDGRLALSDDDQDPAPFADAPATGAGLAGVEAKLDAAPRHWLTGEPIDAAERRRTTPAIVLSLEDLRMQVDAVRISLGDGRHATARGEINGALLMLDRADKEILAVLARGAHGGSAGVVPDELLRLSEAARSGRAEFKIVPQHYPECDDADLPGQILVEGRFLADIPESSRLDVDYEADGAFLVAAWNFIRARIEAEDRARPASGATGEDSTDV